MKRITLWSRQAEVLTLLNFFTHVRFSNCPLVIEESLCRSVLDIITTYEILFADTFWLGSLEFDYTKLSGSPSSGRHVETLEKEVQ